MSLLCLPVQFLIADAADGIAGSDEQQVHCLPVDPEIVSQLLWYGEYDMPVGRIDSHL